MAYVIFWLAMGAFVFSSQLKSDLPLQAYQSYTSSWFGIDALFSLAAMSTSLAFSITYHTGAIPYLVRYSKMKSIGYISGVMISGLITGVVYGLIILGLTDLLFSSHFGISLPPGNILLTIGFIIISALFYTSLAIFLQLVRVTFLGFNPATIQIINFIPLILGFLFGYGALFLNLGKGIYASPIADAEFLLTQGYYGHNLYLNSLAAAAMPTQSLSSNLFSPEIGTLLLIIWTAGLLGVSLLLFNRIYYRSLEEGRIV